MSGTLSAPPTTVDVARRMLATMAALSGTVTDYNIGSQIRTLSESLGSVIDMQGVATEQQDLVALTYGTSAAYGIVAYGAQQAIGLVTFATALGSSPPPASLSVVIPAGTLVATQGGVQYSTNADATLSLGSTSVVVGVTAVLGGTGGNAPAGAITSLLTNVGYPLFVTNGAPLTGGAAAETSSATLARLAAKQASFGLCSPVAVPNACIGVTGTDGTVCRYAACQEPWITNSNTTPGFNLYIDDGTGNASAALLAAVNSTILGSVTNGKSGYRPPGVPFTVNAVAPLHAQVVVTGTLLAGALPAQVQSVITTQVTAYFAQLPFNAPATQPQISAAVANAALGYFSSLTVSLNVTGNPTLVPLIAAGPSNRVLLDSLTVTITSA